ncbi:DUF2062 domain-containing protein [Paracoccus sp. p4-l81]|uniref:DUF2062 domain-containing protein n=1 Tax=unclassified Paracoccus (in: a-proteobacteria) TaxID=2688777 RepID=UPI0035B7BA2A
MVFKRRTPLSWRRKAAELLYPRGGWWRAGSYVLHRVRRLPDQPHRIARGVAAGVFISFTPLFGFHFLGAALLAWLLGGNIIAALLATFVGNPITFPLIAWSSTQLGRWLLGKPGALSPRRIVNDFAAAMDNLWANLRSAFTAAEARWDGLALFFSDLFVPFLLGGVILGLIAAVIAHYLTLPLFNAYQNRRLRLAAARAAKARALQTAAPDALIAATTGLDDAGSADAPSVEPRREDR